LGVWIGKNASLFFLLVSSIATLGWHICGVWGRYRGLLENVNREIIYSGIATAMDRCQRAVIV
jgi:hypothetical protein